MAKGIDPNLMSELIALGDRVTEDRLYEIAVDEVERNELDKVAMALALEEAEGDEKKSRAFYTKHRVRRIKDAIAQQAVMAAQEELEAKEKLRAEELEKENILRSKHSAEDELKRKQNISKGNMLWFAFIVTMICLLLIAVGLSD